MKYRYEIGTVRWLLHSCVLNARCHIAPTGWIASARKLQYDPVTGDFLPLDKQWWTKETYVGVKK